MMLFNEISTGISEGTVRLPEDCKQRAQEQGEALELVTGSAPGWADPWARARRCHVRRDADGYRLTLVDEEGFAVDDRDVQLARLATTIA